MSEQPLKNDPPLVRERPEDEQRLAPDVILRRLDDLEGENRRLRRLGAALLAACAVVLVVGTAMTVVATHGLAGGRAAVRAQRFVLEDASGHVRGTWGVTEEGTVQLALTDSRSEPRARMSVLEDGSPGLGLVDADGHPRAALGLLADGTISLVFADPEGHSRAVLGLTAAGASSLALADGRGVTRAGLGVATGGKPTLTMDDTGREP